MFSGVLDELRRMNKRQFIYQCLSFGMIVSSALMIWKGLMVVTGSESPIVVVLSGSMEPAFHRGDLLFLTNIESDPVRVGEIVVFKVEGRDIPIVHRVVKLHEGRNGTVKFLTKGDNNSVDDRGLYAPGQLWLTSKDMVGRARGFLPYVGMVTIYMNEYPKFKVYPLVKFKFTEMDNIGTPAYNTRTKSIVAVVLNKDVAPPSEAETTLGPMGHSTQIELGDESNTESEGSLNMSAGTHLDSIIEGINGLVQNPRGECGVLAALGLYVLVHRE